MFWCAVRWWLVFLLGCGSAASAREDFVINTLAEDNYLWAMRDPRLVAMKLVKMQRDPFIWMRGTPSPDGSPAREGFVAPETSPAAP